MQVSSMHKPSRAFTVAFQMWLLVTRFDKDKTFSFPFIEILGSIKYFNSFIIKKNNIRECSKLRWQVQEQTFECKVWQCGYSLVFYIYQLGNWEFVLIFLYWKQTLCLKVYQLLVIYTYTTLLNLHVKNSIERTEVSRYIHRQKSLCRSKLVCSGRHDLKWLQRHLA